MTIKTDSYVIGSNVDDTRNFLLDTDLAGALRIRRKSDGTGGLLATFDAAGQVSFPSSPAFLSKSYVSAEQLITAASLLTLPHGMATVPLLYSITLKCVTADLGYSVGDLVPVNVSGDFGSTSSQWGIYHDATNINIRLGSAAIVLTTKGTGVAGTAVNANWRMIVRAWA